MTDYLIAELETDALIDASLAERDVTDRVLPPLTQAEIDATIKRISREIEALDNELPE